ncbi:anthrax toxin receptor-like [Cavia porcellus]|uniref:anthrax toxin receptor-like n=1 Tax=Cavia porcellus TaxID=10141 RepID=UPI002FDF457A
MSNLFLVPLGLFLLLALLLLCCLHQLCRPKRRKPPPPPPPEPEEPEEEPLLPPQPLPPPPAPPVTVCPVIIVCCCACGGVCVNRGPEGTLISCNFSHPSCHQVPLTWSPSCAQGTNFDFLKMLCAEGSWDPRIGLQPNQDDLPLAYCSQCHHQAVQSDRLPSRMLPRSAQMACRPTLSLSAP